MNAPVAKVMQCNRCKKKQVENVRLNVTLDLEHCWYCMGRLCFDCWDKFGHCGHAEADAQNERAKNAGR